MRYKPGESHSMAELTFNAIGTLSALGTLGLALIRGNEVCVGAGVAVAVIAYGTGYLINKANNIKAGGNQTR